MLKDLQCCSCSLESEIKVKYTLKDHSMNSFFMFLFGTIISFGMIMTKEVSDYQYDLGVKGQG